MNSKWIKQGVLAALTMAAAASAQADWRLNGPILQGLQLNGPILQGPTLNGPVIQGVVLNGPIFQGPSLNGPVLQGVILNGPQLQGTSLQSTIAIGNNPYYGRGLGVFAVPSAQARHAVPGHSSLSGIAVANVQIKLAH